MDGTFPLPPSIDAQPVPPLAADTPTKLFLETSLPTSASPYPSPSSAFYPPPIPASHEFANKLGATLAGNKRYRGSGGSHHGAVGGGGPNGVASPISAGGGLGPSSGDSSRRGSASAPSPLATHEPHVARLDGPRGDETETCEDSSASHDRSTSSPNLERNVAADTASPPTASTLASTPPHPTRNQTETANPASANPSPTALPTPTTPAEPNTPTSTYPPTPSALTPATSKRASQIIESLTPIRAAPPSPGPSRRGSLIRRGSSRRWSRGSGALGAGGGGGGGGDSIGPTIPPSGGIGGMAGIGSAWSGEPTRSTSSTVSEDGSLHSDSGEPGSTSSAAASKRASRRLSAFNALAALGSTAEGEVASFSDFMASEDNAYLSPSAASPLAVETETEPVTPATPSNMETTGATAAASSEATMGGETPTTEAGFTALKPILVLDFAFPPDDLRRTKRPLELLSRVERDALSPEERASYARGKRRGEDEWEETADEEEEEEGDGWGWAGVSGLPPRRREGAGGGYEREDGDEEMTPRFGYGFSYDVDATPTRGTSTTPGYDGTEGSVQGEIDPDSPLPPGIYRALYAFEAEGTAEMSLSEGQLVRVVGRGGGVGWAVVERGWRPENSGGASVESDGAAGVEGRAEDGVVGDGTLDPGSGAGTGMASEESSGALGMAGQALVPEGYLEIWMLDGEEWDERRVDF